ncbi:hypothetical protein KDA23_04820 [Candidatus Saccharibacteria bacterium]|nr:hypothetical protein [Candidatus Saccharibacteria bacterium]
MRAQTDESPASVLSQQLLLSLAEQLKLPLLQIARQAELDSLKHSPKTIPAIRVTADSALKLIDSYVLGVQMATQKDGLFESESVSISSVLYDAASELLPFAKAYDVKLDIDLSGKYGPVTANRRGLQAALVSLGFALIEALPAMETPQLRLQLSAHRCRYGIVAGLYSDAQQLTTDALRQGRKLYGRARQPLTGISSGSAAGVFVADALLHGMASQLTVSKHHNLYGLGAILQPNPQLQLV